MDTQFARIMSEIINTPLLVHPRKGAVFYNVLAERGAGQVINLPNLDSASIDALQAREMANRREVIEAAGFKLMPEASRFVGERPPAESGNGYEPFMLTRDGVGIVTITGAMVNRGAWIGSYSGQTSYEGIRAQLARAAADDRVKALVLDMETPGGQAVGMVETAAAVRAVTKRKPVIAVVNGIAASAGYGMASGATKIVTTETGYSGSVGVLLLHADYSAKLALDGIRPTLIYTPAHKADGNSLEPLSADVKSELQQEVNDLYAKFLDTIEAGRGKRGANAARATEGRALMGQAAVDAKIADEVGAFESVLYDLTPRKPSRSSGGAAKGASARMSDDKDRDDMISKADAQRQVATAEQAGYQKGRTEAHARFRAILAHEKVKGHEAFAIKLATKSPDMSLEDLVETLAELPAPAPTASNVRSIAERAAATGADKVNGLPTTEEQNAGRGNKGLMKSLAEERMKSQEPASRR